MSSCSGGHSECVEYLLSSMNSNEMRLNQILSTYNADKPGFTPLIFAANKGHIKCDETFF